MKKIIIVLSIILSLVYLSGFSVTKIGITAIVEHPALEAARQGIMDELISMGLEEATDVIFDYQNAQGNMNTAVSIAKYFDTEGMDIVVGISTPSAQACLNGTRNIPVVFSCVTDPAGASLIPSLGKNPGRVTGICDMTPVLTQLKLLKYLVPDAKKIGYIYNTSEANSITILYLARDACISLGMELIEIAGTSAPEMISALSSIVSSVDAIYIGTDNTAASSIEALSKVAEVNRVPMFLSDIDMARKAAVLGFGFNYYQIGRETGKIIYSIINGIPVSEIESRLLDADSLDLYISLDRAKALGINIPQALVDKATFLVENGVEVERKK